MGASQSSLRSSNDAGGGEELCLDKGRSSSRLGAMSVGLQNPPCSCPRQVRMKSRTTDGHGRR